MTSELFKRLCHEEPNNTYRERQARIEQKRIQGQAEHQEELLPFVRLVNKKRKQDRREKPMQEVRKTKQDKSIGTFVKRTIKELFEL